MVSALFMEWRHVLFANWAVDPQVVEPHVPGELTVDTYDGQAWLSVVPFTNVDVRPRAFPANTGVPLPELNLRTYVSYNETPGVYFFSLDADGLLAVLGARLFHYLPYYYADITLVEAGDEVRFTCRRRHPGARPVAFDATYGARGSKHYPDSGTLEHFLTERYRYYTESPAGHLRYANVRHDPWPLYEADVEIRSNTLFEANGFAAPESDPVYLYSPGVETAASRSKLIAD